MYIYMCACMYIGYTRTNTFISYIIDTDTIVCISTYIDTDTTDQLLVI